MDKIDLLRRMKRIRCVEETIAERYSEQKMRCPTHLSIGQELVGAISGVVLRNSDVAVSTHRGHAHYLGKGGSLPAMIAEIYGKVTGCARGRGGSMHLIDESVGFMGTTAIVGNSIPLGVGLGLSKSLNGGDDISCVFIGDGSIEEGVFYESINFSSVRKLPVLFLCENNLYSVYSPMTVRQPNGRKIHKMVEAMGVQEYHADGADTVATYETIAQAVQHIRTGNGPAFVEVMTYRWLEHCGPNYDNDLPYRENAEFEMWKKRDALENFQAQLLAEGILSPAQLENIENKISDEINQAFEFAEKSEMPDISEAYIDEYASEDTAS